MLDKSPIFVSELTIFGSSHRRSAASPVQEAGGQPSQAAVAQRGVGLFMEEILEVTEKEIWATISWEVTGKSWEKPGKSWEKHGKIMGN